MLGNRALMLLWSGQSVSIIGDNFLNLAIMWVIYTQSGSVLQTALIQVVWHLLLQQDLHDRRLRGGADRGAAPSLGGDRLIGVDLRLHKRATPTR